MDKCRLAVKAVIRQKCDFSNEMTTSFSILIFCIEENIKVQIDCSRPPEREKIVFCVGIL